MALTRVPGREVHFRVHGAGPLLLVQPGLYQVGPQWTDLGYTGALAGEYTVVEIDPLGHGRSAAPTDPAAYELPRRVDDVLAVLDELGADRAVYWGYSMGAWIGCGLAAYAPDRVAGLVVGGWDPVGGLEVAYEHARRTVPLPPDPDWTALARAAAARVPEQAAVIDAGDPVAFDACHRSLEHQPDLSPALAALDVPVLLYAGDADPYHPGARAVAARIGAGFATVAGCDHTGAWHDATAVLAEVVPFLRTVAR
ncbi:alpha/beta fold hydrolase [Actinocatenispora rupis]|uniref:Alpha/beta hydrolase n=1 Tax=Actinocatenispora rupis TaxID=519421 RepID=A0A8J3NCQ6_9ACTN|nr:alpha/beta hydrolase [Actinocatenispora rupis]GID14569.1 alpha/beta hydrolase [Actinocatenispora rupis]